MHYYQFNIGDYRRQTGHLSLVEHGIYRSLLDTYYLTERFLCSDNAKLMRTHGIRTEEEKTAFNNIMGDFFELTESGYFHKSCEEVIAKYQEKSEKARKSANARWKKDANALRTHTEGNADGMLTNNHKPITTNQEPKDKPLSSVDDCPHEEIIALYHEHCPALASVQVWNDKRKRWLKARWREDKKRQDLDWWEGYFQYVSGCPFLMGSDGKWQATLEWLINESNMIKVIEGNYESQGVGNE